MVAAQIAEQDAGVGEDLAVDAQQVPCLAKPRTPAMEQFLGAPVCSQYIAQHGPGGQLGVQAGESRRGVVGFLDGLAACAGSGEPAGEVVEIID